jgi:ketosteroid isomerase-like protein
MQRIRGRFTALALMLVALACVSGTAAAQNSKKTDMEAVRAANAAFYAALSSRDSAAIEKLWSKDADIQNIGPRSKTVDVGWAEHKKTYDTVFEAFPELKVWMDEPRIKVNGSTAWVSGIEKAERKTKAGQAVTGTNLGTSIFVKQGARWLMVYHHASAIPQ